MKFSIKAEVERAETLTAGLTIDNDAGVRMARERLQNLKDEALRADQRLHAAQAHVQELRVSVGAGEARMAQLEEALVMERAAALVHPQYGARVTLAEAAVDQAIADAKALVITKTGRQRDKLQRVADELRPVLEALRDAEAALDACMHAVKPGSVVVPLEWPQSLDDEGAQRNAMIQAVARPGAA